MYADCPVCGTVNGCVCNPTAKRIQLDSEDYQVPVPAGRECDRIGCPNPADLPVDVEGGDMAFVCFYCNDVFDHDDQDAVWGSPERLKKRVAKRQADNPGQADDPGQAEPETDGA